MKSVWVYENEKQWEDGREARAYAIFNVGLLRVSTTPMPESQKFRPGTFVMIAKNLGRDMSHFESGCPACVQYTYQHAYGGGMENEHRYSLLVRHEDARWFSIAWYNENQIEEITDTEMLKQLRKELGLEIE